MKITDRLKEFAGYNLRRLNRRFCEPGVVSIKGLKHVFIEPTNRCNLRCAICSNTFKRPQGNIELSTYKRIVGELGEKCPDVEVRVFFSGEPLLYPGIDELIRIAKGCGLHDFLIHTNAILMTEDLAKKLIDAGLTKISFSIDGGSKEAYEEIRGKGNFGKAVKGAQAFLNVNDKRVHTIVQVIKKYPQELQVSDDFRRLFDGADKIYVKHPHSWAEAGSVKDSMPAERQFLCNFLYRYFQFYWNGDAVVCCACLNGEYVLGNIKDSSVEELFNSDVMRVLRLNQERRQPVDPKYPCAKCERYQTVKR